MPRRVRAAVLIAFILNGILILSARYRLSYDAYTHMLLADHYRLDWWSLWDPRWFAGFAVNSYPPLVHQLIALLGRLVGVDAGYAIVMWATVTAMPLAVYALSRIFVDRGAAGYASLGAALLPSIYLSAYTFGQLPTLFSLVFALLCGAALAEFLRSGSRTSGGLAVALAVVVMAAHHATLLLLPFLVLAVAVHLVLNHQVSLKDLAMRFTVFGVLSAAAIALVIWPFWQWGAGQSLQTPIDHPTRHNYFTDPSAALEFFWAMYGPLVVFIPVALWKGRSRRFLGLSAAFLGLFLLGLGGTTPLPRLIFGSAWEWLTYDRFALWASILLLPFFGIAAGSMKIWVESGPLLRKLAAISIPIRKERFKRIPALLPLPWTAVVLLPLLATASLITSLLPSILPTQPPAVDMQPVVNFLAQGGRSQWRYLTFGFGDQSAYLNRLTSATTIDGSYFTARTLPELRSSGIGQIDGAFWQAGGMAKLGPILQGSGALGVRWGFVDRQAYDPVLRENGWLYQSTLSNGIEVWENPAAVLPAPSTPPAADPAAAFSWGVLPLLALALAMALSGLRFRPAAAQKFLFGLHSLAVGLLPVGLVLWYFFPLTTDQAPRVYFTYNNALVFLSDALAFVGAAAWALGKYLVPHSGGDKVIAKEGGHIGPPLHVGGDLRVAPISGSRSIQNVSFENTDVPEIRPNRIIPPLRAILQWPLAYWMFALCGLASLSILWSTDRPLSLYLSLHLWLVYTLILSLRDRPAVWRFAAAGLCAALALEVVTGLAEYAMQTTAFLSPFKLFWPGTITPSTSGASILLLPDGTRWLRAYGTLPHPNILGTFLAVLLGAPVALFLVNRRLRILPGLLFISGLALLAVTFSRAAWIGGLAAGILIFLKTGSLVRKRALTLGIAGALSLAAVVFPLRSQIDTRIGLSPQPSTEQFSINGRLWLAGQALQMIGQHPILGGGIGSFELELAQRAPIGYLVEPVHNLPLLVTSDLGIGGALVLAGIGLAILRGVRKTRRPESIVLSAALVALGVTSLFDHSLWTLAPGRVLTGFMLGLWAGQMRQDEA